MRRTAELFSLIVLVFLVIAGTADAAALTAARNTPTRAGKAINLVVTNGLTIYAGAMVAVAGNGEAINAADAAGIQIVGRANETVDNTSDGESIEVGVGIFGWVNSDTVSDADIGSIAYVVDNQTVSVTNSGSNSAIAVIVTDVDDSYVWVSTFHIDRTAGSFSTLTVSGASTLSGTLRVDGALDINEEIDLDLDAADETINIKQSSTAGETNAALIYIDDNRTGASANATNEATIEIDAEGTYALHVKDGEAYFADTVTVEDLFRMGAQTMSVNTGQAITNTSSYVRITTANLATSTVTVHNASSGVGELLVIENATPGSTNIVIEDNSTTMAIGGDVTLGATDTLTLIYSATAQWRELCTANN